MAAFDDGVVTYAEVASWLPAHIVEAIEVTGPCPAPDADEHVWCQEEIVIRTMSSVVRVDAWWECYLCHQTTGRNPREHVLPAGDLSPLDLWRDYLLGD